VVAPDRIPVLDPFDIVPHPVAVDDSSAGGLADRQHTAVDIVRHAGDHPLRRRPKALRPISPHQVVIAADAARGDDDGLGFEFERPDDVARAFPATLDVARSKNFAPYPVDRAARFHQFVDAMAELESDQPIVRALTYPFDKGRDNGRPGAPGQVETRHRIAVADRTAAAALGPPDNGKEPQTAFAQPRALLAGGKSDKGFGPLARPEILVAIEGGRPHPVFERQSMRIANAHAPLFGRVDEEYTAQRPECLTAKRLFGLLIEDDDFPSRVDKLRRRDQTRQPRSNDNCVGVISQWQCVAVSAPISATLPAQGAARSLFGMSSCRPRKAARTIARRRCLPLTNWPVPRRPVPWCQPAEMPPNLP
jgi:hypothetical protein